MVLHGGAGVYPSQGRLDVNHELVVEAAMVNVVTNGADPQSKTLASEEKISWGVHVLNVLFHLIWSVNARGGLEDAVNAVGHMEAV